MVADWGMAPLDELVDDVLDRRGVTPLKLGSDFVSHGHRVISAKLIKNRRVDLSADEPRFVDEATYRKWMRTPLFADDVILTSEAPLGEAAYISEQLEWCLGQRLFCIRTKKKRLLGRFLYYALQSEHVAHELHSRATGTTAQGIRQTELRLVNIPLPTIDEQRAIAGILGALDDLIDLNRSISETLEAMTRALFKSWFVDFDPVRAKAEGRDAGLPKAIADLFPSSFEDSELGEVPKGWEVTSLGGLVATVKGRSYRSEELVESDTALVTLRSFARGGGYRPDGLKSFVGTYKPDQIVRPGEVVIACTDVTQAAEVIGRPAIVRGTSGYRTLVASLDTLIVRPRHSNMTRAFIYYLGGTEAFVAHTYAHTTGTTVLHLAKEAVPSFTFALPSPRLVDQFDSLASQVLGRVQVLEEESETIAALRDTLLPKLFSGELRIADTGRVIERATE